MLVKDKEVTTQEYWDATAMHCYSGKSPEVTELIRVNLPKVRYIAKKIFEYDMTNINILEIGCGVGMVSAMVRLMYMKNINLKATDVSPVFASGAKSMFGLDTYVAQANKLPFKDKEFDAIFMFDVLEHIHPDERADSYRDIDRVLKSGGMMFINNPLDADTSGHDKAFDHGFDFVDLGSFCEWTHSRVTLLKEWGLGEKRKYQWITLEKE